MKDMNGTVECQRGGCALWGNCGVVGQRDFTPGQALAPTIFLRELTGVGIRAFHPHPNPLPRIKSGAGSEGEGAVLRQAQDERVVGLPTHVSPEGEGTCWWYSPLFAYLYLPCQPPDQVRGRL